MSAAPLLLALAPLAPAPAGPPAVEGPRANVVVITTDDQDPRSLRARRADGRPVMHELVSRVAAQGATFAESFVSYPLCSPSRATLLTGQLAHNHRVLGNDGPLGGYAALDHANTLPVWLQAAGYHTAHVGKYLNGYTGGAVPPGWDEWYTSWGGSYYNYFLNENGTNVGYGTAAASYHTDVMTEKAVDFLRSRSYGDRPFFLKLDYLAVHAGNALAGGTVPAPRHLGAMAGHVPEWVPSFNELDLSDKPPSIQAAYPLLSDEQVRDIVDLDRRRLEMLLSVDEGIGRVLRTLDELGELDRTYVFFTVDNGYMRGEHRIGGGKNQPYEESIRAPLLVRGPGVAAGAVIDRLVSNVDLAPTWVEIAGASAGRPPDGRSLLPLLEGRDVPWREVVLIESFQLEPSLPPAPPAIVRPYRGLRTAEHLYLERNSPAGTEVELYLFADDGCGAADPFQLASAHADPCQAATIEALRARLAGLTDCAGAGCW